MLTIHRRYFGLIALTLTSAACTLVFWPAPIPDPDFTLQTELNYLEIEDVTGNRPEELEEIYEHHRQSANFESRVSATIFSALICGFSLSHIFSLAMGWGQKHRRHPTAIFAKVVVILMTADYWTWRYRYGRGRNIIASIAYAWLGELPFQFCWSC